MSKNLSKIVFASDYLHQAAIMLEETHPDIAEVVLLLSQTIYNELPDTERTQIDIAMMDIELKREEMHGGC
jgi:hypothetical protein